MRLYAVAAWRGVDVRSRRARLAPLLGDAATCAACLGLGSCLLRRRRTVSAEDVWRRCPREDYAGAAGNAYIPPSAHILSSLRRCRSHYILFRLKAGAHFPVRLASAARAAGAAY